ncbi:MAG: hypothetical protein KKA73_09905 [Chloroflexi bacterium]|nr:hypothetical protein [Chloroflexota bacterium]
MAHELGPDQLLVLQYHIGDDYATWDTLSRYGEYGISTLPAATFDGSQNMVPGAISLDWCYQQYKSRVEGEGAKSSNVSLVVCRTTTANAMHLAGTVTNRGTTGLTDVDLRFVVVENLGVSGFQYVVRAMLSPQRITSLAPGASVTLQGDVSLSGGIDWNRVQAVALVQDPSPPDRLVLQAALAHESAAALQVNRTSLQFLIGPDDPITSTQTVQIDNAGACALTWTAITDAPWLAVTPSPGTAPGTLAVVADKSDLAAGHWYTGQVTITASAGALYSPQIIPVSLYPGTLYRVYLPLTVKNQ